MSSLDFYNHIYKATRLACNLLVKLLEILNIESIAKFATMRTQYLVKERSYRGSLFNFVLPKVKEMLTIEYGEKVDFF